jgi:hypothetical protein
MQNKLKAAIARKSAELAALERQAAEAEAERIARRAAGVTLTLILPGQFMKELARWIEDLDDGQAFSRALDVEIEQALKPPSPRRDINPLFRDEMPGHVMLRNAGQIHGR